MEHGATGLAWAYYLFLLFAIGKKPWGVLGHEEIGLKDRYCTAVHGSAMVLSKGFSSNT